MFKRRKFETGYQKNTTGVNKKKSYKSRYLASLFVSKSERVSIFEKITKFIIYICLRLVIPNRHWKTDKSYIVIENAYKKLVSSDTVFIPSSISFYFIMAFVPVVTIIFYIFEIPFLNNIVVSQDGSNYLVEFMSTIIPGVDVLIGEVIQTIQGSAAITGATISFLIISIWISASGFAKLIYTQSHIFNHKFVKVFWLIKIKGVLIVMSFAILVFLLILPLSELNSWINGFANATQITRSAANGLFQFFQILILFGWTFLIILLLFKFSPKFRIKFRQILPGTIVAAIPSFLFLSLFSYITSLWSYDQYAIFGAVMYIAMAMFLLSYFIFIGINVNASYYKVFINQKLKSKWTFSKWEN